jgi:hypothetical protein
MHGRVSHWRPIQYVSVLAGLGLQLTITLTNEIVDRYAKRQLKILPLGNREP